MNNIRSSSQSSAMLGSCMADVSILQGVGCEINHVHYKPVCCEVCIFGQVVDYTIYS